eukprot:TRINITY_DN933_c0_g1_i2.p1 TRINITY_DN933_c0_g1~~TRINITY_DN933_c0_g1_i2.p1  ORF type:complete len:493 (-),score=96.05 TRINITY_DN933_c0_g1_i2:80-1558(-)
MKGTSRHRCVGGPRILTPMVLFVMVFLFADYHTILGRSSATPAGSRGPSKDGEVNGVLDGHEDDDEGTGTELTRIAFGSCAQFKRAQPFWRYIKDYKAQLFVWLGDITYADTHVLPGYWQPSSVDVVQHKFDLQKNVSGYRELLTETEGHTPPHVLGVYDDHDANCNDGGGHQCVRLESTKNTLLNFLDEPMDSIRRTRDGLYGSWVYGPVGRRVRVILLDTRTFLDKRVKAVLGEAQWAWLEKELFEKSDDVQLTLLGSSIQFVAEGKPLGEEWFVFPGERARLLSLLKRSECGGVVVLSGDVHYSEIASMACTPEADVIEGEDHLLPYPLIEITSSSLTHSWGSLIPEPISSLIAYILPSHMRVDGTFYFRNNYATMDIEWERRELEVCTHDATTGDVVVSRTISFDQLRARDPPTEEDRAERLRQCVAEEKGRHAMKLFNITLKTLLVTAVYGVFHLGWLISRWVAKRRRSARDHCGSDATTSSNPKRD